MRENKNIQKSALFDDSLLVINTSSNDSNIVHKQFATSTISNNTKIPLKTETKMSADEWNSIVNKNAFPLMSNKSLRNRYATTGL